MRCRPPTTPDTPAQFRARRGGTPNDPAINAVPRRSGVLAVGAVHLQQYIAADYRAIPTIEPLFLLNAIGSGVVSIGLLLPVDRPSTARLGRVVVGVLALGAVAIAAASLA